MKKYIFIVMLLIAKLNGMSQESIKLELGYGLLTFRELENVFLYTSSSPGLVYAKLGIVLDDKIWVSALGAYDKTQLNASGNDEFYIETQSLLIYIHHTLFERSRYKIYCAGGVGIQQQNKNLLTGITHQRIPAYEIVPVALSYALFSKAAMHLEAGYGAIVPLKIAFVYNF